ncbi:MAG: acetate--CoA ligase family protein, partial [Fibrobacteria bacterium]|nr:acetate--CoA ligase family protein [Fibrobacteria bacterium]
LTCFPDIQSCESTPELCVISIPTAFVEKTVSQAIATGVKAVIIITAGFKELNKNGAALEGNIARMCKSKGVHLLGPNCLGLINVNHHMNASFAQHMPRQGGISIISQSGALCTAILDWAMSRNLGLANLISMGNKADLSETDFLTAFAEDDETKVVVGYLESIGSGDEFMKAAEHAASHKPVVMFKSGVTSAGGKAASSHTGSLAGADIAYGAAFKRSGVIRADTFESLFDYAMAFEMQPLPRGKRVAIITNAGGPGIMAADAVELSGMEVCTLEGASAAALRDKLPAAASVGNPIDVLGDADPERYALAVETALRDETVDAVIIILTPQAMTRAIETAEAIAAQNKHTKPVLVSFMGGLDVSPGRDALMKAGIPDYPSPERAVAALRAMAEYAEWRNRPPRIITRFPVNRRRAERIINRHIRTGQFQMGEAQAKAILRAYNFNVPPGAVAATAEEAVERANKIGFPVAMKIVSKDIIHKSDIGGVKLNLNSTEEVRDAFDLMTLRIKQKMPNAFIEGVYLEQMCGRGREVILGMTRDPQFGPMLMFGLGGIFVEVMKDVTFHIAPITEAEARQMLETTKSYALLKGVRGQRSVDMNAIALSLQRISQLVTDFPQIIEMDINPFIVGLPGDPSIAADARITLSNPGESL